MQQRGTHMSQETQRNNITKRRVVYQIPGVDAVSIRRDVEYRANDAGVQTMDIYYPPDSKSGARIPAVVFVSGFSDLGFQKVVGCKLKEMESYISWGQLAAASGLVAITYTNREWEVDRLLRRAGKEGIILAGITTRLWN